MAIEARWRRLMNNPGQVLANRTKSLVRRAVRPVVVEWSRRSLERDGHLDFMANRPPEAFGGDFADLWYLYRLVRQHRPAVIVEFGSGCSTVVLAQALFDEARVTGRSPGFLYSIETTDQWREVTLGSIPEHLRGLCEVRHGPVRVVEHQGQPVFVHENVPEVQIDMLYLDSPALTDEVRVAADPVLLEKRLSSGFVGVVDGRPENVRFLKENLGHRYDFRENVVLGSTVFQRR
jgi:hypothetical protein